MRSPRGGEIHPYLFLRIAVDVLVKDLLVGVDTPKTTSTFLFDAGIDVTFARTWKVKLSSSLFNYRQFDLGLAYRIQPKAK